MEKHGLLFALLTAFLWGSSPIIEKLGLLRTTPLAGVAIRSISITIILLFTLFFTNLGKQLLQVDFKTIALVALGGIISGLLGQWAYFRALKYWEASKVVPIVGTYPLIAFIFSLTFLREELTLQKVMGVILVVVGVILLK
jgi:transporter family protein